jgi:outer membrane protein assembly factor BamB
VDGSRVIACFGSEGLYAFDFDGTALWKKDLGVLDSGFYMVPSAQWGFASSPVIWDELVLLQVDVHKGSYLAAFDKQDGKEVWRTARKEIPTWGTPTVVETAAGARVVVNGYKHIGGYDLASGKEVWKLVGGGDIPVPTPVLLGDLVFITNAHGMMAPIYAVRADAEGELQPEPEKEPALQWMNRRRGNYMQTPLAYGTRLYLCSDAGIMACYEPETGEEIWRERLGDGNAGFTASPVAADGKIYMTSEEGRVYTVLAGDEFEIVGINELGETCMATPAISEGAIFFRTRSHLVTVSEE